MKRRLKKKLPRHVNYRLAVFQEHDFKNKQTNKQTNKHKQTNKQQQKLPKKM